MPVSFGCPVEKCYGEVWITYLGGDYDNPSTASPVKTQADHVCTKGHFITNDQRAVLEAKAMKAQS